MLDTAEAWALTLAIAVHELGHITALALLGCQISGIELRICGLRLEYSGCCCLWKQAVSAAAGPAAGFILALLMSGLHFRSAALCAGLSMLLSLFNLLPVPPLDGGRMSEIFLCAVFGGERGMRLQRLLVFVFSGAMGLGGIYALCCGKGAGLLLAAAAVLGSALREECNTMNI